MNRYLKLAMPLLVLSCFSSFASSLGVQGESAPLIEKENYTIYPSIPFIEGADLMAFHEAYSKTRSEQFGELVQSAESLIKAGASGKEALDMVIAFDKLITKRKEDSKKRMGVSLEGYFNSRLNDLYQYYNPEKRRLDFRHVDIPRNILDHVNQGFRPGYATDEMLNELDFVIYGSFSANRNKAQIDVALYVVNVHSGITRVYGGSGYPEQAAYQAADKLFDEFQRTQMPKTYSLKNGKRITLVKEGRIAGGYAAMKNLYVRAQTTCEMAGARLASEEELLSLDALGRYNGGITLYEDFSNFVYNRHGRGYYHWALKNNWVYNAAESRSTETWNLNSSEVLNFQCVK